MRWGRRAAGGPVAAVTMVRDEGEMLRRWVAHYSAQVGAENLLVIDDNSTDGSTDALDCEVVRIEPITGHFELERMRIVSEHARRLLKRRSAVVFADADEFIVPDPTRHADLREFVAARPGVPASGVLGLNVVHHLATEGPLDLTRPLLAQRRLVKFIPLLCKPSVKQVPAAWAAASHGIHGTVFAPDPELFMFHFKFADRDILQRIADHRRRMVELDERAAESSWQFTGDEMVDLLDRINAEGPGDPDLVPVFEPDPAKLAEVVLTQDNGVSRAAGLRQVKAMRRRPMRRIPERFAGIL